MRRRRRDNREDLLHPQVVQVAKAAPEESGELVRPDLLGVRAVNQEKGQVCPLPVSLGQLVRHLVQQPAGPHRRPSERPGDQENNSGSERVDRTQSEKQEDRGQQGPARPQQAGGELQRADLGADRRPPEPVVKGWRLELGQFDRPRDREYLRLGMACRPLPQHSLVLLLEAAQPRADRREESKRDHRDKQRLGSGSARHRGERKPAGEQLGDGGQCGDHLSDAEPDQAVAVRGRGELQCSAGNSCRRPPGPGMTRAVAVRCR